MLFRGQTLGKYRIVTPLGSGGFGTVYLAEDTWIDKKVAIKVAHKQTTDFGELLKEPRLLAALGHPNIVSVITAEKQDNVFFIVMEYIPGETLENIIARDGALELSRALDYTCQIANAVDHAHRQNVIHRDLRPANVLVSDNDVLKVADFGTSRFLEIAAHQPLEVRRRRRVVRQHAREHLVHRDADRVDVGREDGLALKLLGRHVGRTANNGGAVRRDLEKA